MSPFYFTLLMQHLHILQWNNAVIIFLIQVGFYVFLLIPDKLIIKLIKPETQTS